MSLRSLVRTLSILFALTLAMPPAIARADEVPRCQGSDKPGAQHARALGLQHYRASKRSGVGDSEMTSALGFFDAACAAGDDTALELRAYALAGLERFVEAAKSLDAFMTAHPMDSLPDDVKARVEAQAPEILRHVASLSVTSKPDGARVSLNHRAIGAAPIKDLRLAPGTYDLEVTSDTGTQKRTADLAEGTSEETFDFTPKADVEPPPPPPPPRDKPKSSLTPWVIATGVLAAAGVGVGFGGAIWSSSSADSYNRNTCGKISKPAGCDALLSDVNAGFTLEVVGFVAGSALAIATGFLLVLELAKTKPQAAVLCAPSLSRAESGAVCSFKF